MDNIVAKAQRSLNLLRRNFSCYPSSIKRHAYTCIVRPILEYASAAWSPSTQRDINKLESLNRRAARFAFAEYRNEPGIMTQLYETQEWQTIYKRCMVSRLSLLHRLIYTSLLSHERPLEFSNQSTRTRTNTLQISRPFCWTLQASCSFYPRTITEWNSLPQVIVESSSGQAFKNNLWRDPQALEATLNVSDRILHGDVTFPNNPH